MRAPTPTSLLAIAQRLRLSRQALGYSQTAMALLIDSSPSLWGNYEAGIRRIPLDNAFQLKPATGLTLEWIFCGDLSGLPGTVATKILDHMKHTKEGTP